MEVVRPFRVQVSWRWSRNWPRRSYCSRHTSLRVVNQKGSLRGSITDPTLTTEAPITPILSAREGAAPGLLLRLFKPPGALALRFFPNISLARVSFLRRSRSATWSAAANSEVIFVPYSRTCLDHRVEVDGGLRGRHDGCELVETG